MPSEIDYQDYQTALLFDRRSSRLVALEPLVHALIDGLHLKEDYRVLDVGTGTGRLGLMLCDKLPKGSLVGIDSGRGMLKLAKEKTMQRGVENFWLVRGEAESLPFLPRVLLSLHDDELPPLRRPRTGHEGDLSDTEAPGIAILPGPYPE